MKPVLVLQHLPTDGPGYLAEWLAGEGVAMDLRASADDYPADLSGHRGLAVLGGEMSANDPLPAMHRGQALIRDAIARGVPVIGHCLGGQLMARALGQEVAASPLPEIGWHGLDWQPAAAGWFGDGVLGDAAPLVFQWHDEAFSLPPGATRLAGNAACVNQAFALGPHLAMQFHVELDAAKLSAWIDGHIASRHRAHAGHPRQIQSAEQMLEAATARLAAQQRLAAHAYRRWLSAAG